MFKPKKFEKYLRSINKANDLIIRTRKTEDKKRVPIRESEQDLLVRAPGWQGGQRGAGRGGQRQGRGGSYGTQFPTASGANGGHSAQNTSQNSTTFKNFKMQ